MDDSMITTEQLARMLAVSVRSVEGWRRDDPHRLPPHVPVGNRCIRYRLSTVRKWLAEQEQQTVRDIYNAWGDPEADE